MPCGIQNFDRSSAQFKELLFDNIERQMVERFSKRYGEVKVESDGTRNLRFAWWPGKSEGTDSYYLDSDGFIFAVGPSPKLPFLADGSFTVPRTDSHAGPWSPDYPLTTFQANVLFE